MSKWMVSMKKSDFQATAEKFGIRDITARLLTNRGITSDEDVEMYLHGNKTLLHDPYELSDIQKGAAIIIDEISKNSAIRVIGDYDVDGICSTYILVNGLRMFGADVDYVLPDRVKDGYGLSIKLVEDAHEAGKNVILTCDNGIAAAEQITHAKEMGMTVVVTDHHEVPVDSDKEILPEADAVIDPKRRDDKSSFREICGAVVAYKFLQVVAMELGRMEEAQVTDFFDEMLVFAGLATVCDVMELRDENRVIVKESLKRIADTGNIGLKALINVNKLDADAMSAFHYGFVIGPCLNASGRLDLASRAMSLFLEDDYNKAVAIATDLKDLNDSRKDMTVKGVDRASELIDTEIKGDGLPKVLVVFLPEVHESIAGIIAGRIREKYNRPTIILTEAAREDDDPNGQTVKIAKGSGRSIEKYDMFAELSKVKELFTKFGGHKMAAGLSLPVENIEKLRKSLNENCALSEEDFVPVLHLDMALPFSAVDEDLIHEFSLLEPFGNGNTKPVFAHRNVKLLSGRILGKNKNCGKYRVSDESGKIFEMMFFGDLGGFHEFLTESFGDRAADDLYNGYTDGSMMIKVAYYPSINSYMGKNTIQMVMSDYCL
ncbi:MAG: single-stranded-DNA-specific exonuclease RecJ [Butyrivibrio sp.]|nr:single-stranded-DNA-specific exonuclease RecJ [Butyrivibrio sp.]MBR1641149.1 single-stranded-DNA-specific exonuclease RecJ [Butyrivibrio sp.]